MRAAAAFTSGAEELAVHVLVHFGVNATDSILAEITNTIFVVLSEGATKTRGKTGLHAAGTYRVCPRARARARARLLAGHFVAANLTLVEFVVELQAQATVLEHTKVVVATEGARVKPHLEAATADR